MLKKLFVLFVSGILLLALFGCSSQPNKTQASAPKVPTLGTVEIVFPFEEQAGDSTNQFAVWIEDANGKHLKTLAATAYSAKKGVKKTYLLPTWVAKSQLANMQKSEIDAFTIATPKTGSQHFTWDCTDAQGQAVAAGEYTYVVEGVRFMNNRVLYTGKITLGKEKVSNIATKKVIEDDGKNQNMLGEVKAAFAPAK